MTVSFRYNKRWFATVCTSSVMCTVVNVFSFKMLHPHINKKLFNGFLTESQSNLLKFKSKGPSSNANYGSKWSFHS